MKQLTAGQIFPALLLRQCEKVEVKKADNFVPLVELYIEEINKMTEQENDIKYLAYVLEYIFSSGIKKV